jgi:hypothetical protein
MSTAERGHDRLLLRLEPITLSAFNCIALAPGEKRSILGRMPSLRCRLVGSVSPAAIKLTANLFHGAPQ